MQYPLTHYCLYVSIYGISKKQLVPKLLLQVSVQMIHNITVSPPEECVLKEVRDADNNIIIDDSTFHDFSRYATLTATNDFVYRGHLFELGWKNIMKG